MTMDREHIMREVRTVMDEVIAHRRHMHANPELSFREFATSRYISSVLEGAGIPHREIAGTGILATIEGAGDLRNAVVLRADIDALPIAEETGLNFASSEYGCMHACGHDVHAAVLLGALLVLQKNRSCVRGTVFGLFQPGEEVCPGGATLVLATDPFENYNVRAFIGEHVEPSLPTGVFGFRGGRYMASSDEIRLTVRGKGGHAAMRENLKDPVLAASEMVACLHDFAKTERETHNELPFVISIGKMIANGATNVIPDEVYMEGTMRTFDETQRQTAKDKMRLIAGETAEKYALDVKLDITDGYPVLVNTPSLTQKAMELTTEMFGPESVISLEMRNTSEDFAYYTMKYPSVFYRLGVGGKPESDSSDRKSLGVGALHTSRFTPDEEAIEPGIAEFVNLAINL